MGTTEETLRSESEARRASAERLAAGRYSSAVAQYLAAYDYAERKIKERHAHEEHGGRRAYRRELTAPRSTAAH